METELNKRPSFKIYFFSLSTLSYPHDMGDFKDNCGGSHFLSQTQSQAIIAQLVFNCPHQSREQEIYVLYLSGFFGDMRQWTIWRERQRLNIGVNEGELEKK